MQRSTKSKNPESRNVESGICLVLVFRIPGFSAAPGQPTNLLQIGWILELALRDFFMLFFGMFLIFF